MKITDVRLILFGWTGIAEEQYGHHTGRFGGQSELGLLTIAMDDGVEGHAFLGSAMRGAHKGLVHAMNAPRLGAVIDFDLIEGRRLAVLR